MVIDSLKYFIFGAIEFSGIIVLTLALFRMDLWNHKWEILSSSFITSLLSLILYKMDLHNIGIALQILCVSLCFIYIFKAGVRRSIVVSIFGYIAYLFFQNIFLYVLIVKKVINVNDLVPDTTLSNILQVSTVIIIFMIAFAVKKTNQGFGYFVDILFERTKTSVVAVLTAIFTAIITGGSYFLFFEDKLIIFFIINLSLIVVVTSIMSYYFVRHDNKTYRLN